MLRKLKIRGKMIFGYGVVMVFMLVIAFLALNQFKMTNKRLQEFVNGALVADTSVKMCRIDVNIAARTLREMALKKDMTSFNTDEAYVREKLKDLDGYLAALKDTGVIEEELYKRYETAISDWVDIGNRVLDELRVENKDAAAEIILTECTASLQKAIDIAKEIDVITEKVQSEVLNEDMKAVNTVSMVIIAALIIATILAVLIARKIIRGIVRPLNEIEGVTEEISKGNLRAQITYDEKDEVGNIARSLQSSIHTLATYIDDIGRAMQSFSAGDFVVQPSQPFLGDFKNIEDSFDGFMNKMAETMHHIQAVSDQVAAGSEQVAVGASDIARGAGEQASVVEELLATIVEITEKVKMTAENTEIIKEQVDNVGGEIEVSDKKMQEMVLAMDKISESSDKISNIIATINDIAAQTNLLALNASIEAARAGESGKGFAVVADQVGILATQSAEAAKNSTQLIEESLEAVERGKLIVDETAQGLKNVVVGAKAITGKVNEIAIASKEEADAVTQISEGVEHISEAVQMSAATAEESTASSEELTGQAEALKQLIEQFNVRK